MNVVHRVWDLHHYTFHHFNIQTLTYIPTYFLTYFHQYYFFRSTWHIMFPHTDSQIVINIYCVTFLQCVWIKPNSSGLTNVENVTSNFRQFIQICCREKEKEENRGNCKAFCVTRKRKNTVSNTKICFS